ncbi:MAG: DsbA family oxidoreductase [Acidimicrobiales bacterium]
MLVEVWSDVICPWCYIGKRNLEAALASFEHAGDVEVRWRSFELDPRAPKESATDLAGSLAAKYGTDRAGALSMMDRVASVAEGVGLHYRFDLAHRSNTFDAHRVIHLAANTGGAALQDAVKERLLAAYFTEGADLADAATLERLAVEAGLDGTAVATMLAGDDLAAEVRDDEATAHELGISGVPFFLVDGAAGVSGAQPPERLLLMLQRAWEKSHA